MVFIIALRSILSMTFTPMLTYSIQWISSRFTAIMIRTIHADLQLLEKPVKKSTSQIVVDSNIVSCSTVSPGEVFFTGRTHIVWPSHIQYT